MQAPKGEETILAEVLALPPEQRAAYLALVTKGNDDLRHRIEALLRGYQAGDFLEEAAAPELRQTLDVAFPLTEKPGERIGRYKLLQQIGEGGCGVVYMAEQEEPVRRRVALKILKLGMDTKSVIARFEAERQALALMDHSNIAQVYDAGATETGRPYFVMELVRGMKITEYCDQAKLSTRARLDLFIEVCQAIQHAHQKGIIHRDIKPSNILVTVNDGVPVPKVIDFGIAKATAGQQLTDKTLFTAFEQFIGTPAYMSPEQAVLTSVDIDTRSDIYALGVLLYELLTGKTPLDARELLAVGLDEMRRTIREQEPPRPSTRLSALPGNELSTTAQRRGLDAPKLVSELRGDLDWIVMKALEKDRARRYETANGLAMDVRRHLDNEPVVARPPSRLYGFQKLVRRHRLAFAAGAAVTGALVVGLIASSWMFFREKTARHRAQLAEQAEIRLRQEAETARKNESQARSQAQEEELRTRRFLYVSDMNQAGQALQDGNLRRAVALLDRHRSKPGETDLRDWEWRYLWQLSRSDELFSLGSHSNFVKAVAFSPDGKRVVSGGYGSQLFVWDADRRKLVTTLTEDGAVQDVAFSPDGRLLATAGTKRIVIRDADTFQIAASIPQGCPPHRIRFSPNSQQLAVLYPDAHGAVWDRSGWRQHVSFQMQPSLTTPHFALAYSPDGKSLAVAEGPQGRILFVDSGTGQPLARWMGFSSKVEAVAFSPDGQTLASAEFRTVRLRRVPSGEVIWSATNHTEFVNHVAFAPDGRTLASSSGDQSIRLWDLATGRELSRLQGTLEELWGLAWSPDGQFLVDGGKDGTLKVWSAVPKEKRVGRSLVRNNVGFFDFAPDGVTLLLWDLESKKRFVESGFPLSIAPARDFVAFAGGVNPAGEDLDRLYLMGTGDGRMELLGQYPEAIEQIAFSPDTKLIATAGGYEGVCLWDASSRRRLAVLRNGFRLLRVLSVAFSPDGRRLATASIAGVIQLWDLATHQDVLTLEVPRGDEDYAFIERLRFSPDGLGLVALLRTGECYRWQVPSLEAINAAEAIQPSPEMRIAARVDLPTMPSRQGTIAEAEDLQRAAVEPLRKLGETETIEPAQALAHLAGTCYEQQCYAEAEVFYRQALKLQRVLHGGEHFNIAASLNNLANSIAAQPGQTRTQEAESLYREALAIHRNLQRSGTKHRSDLTMAELNLAGLFLETGNLAEAEKGFREALAVLRQASPKDPEDEDPQLAWTLHHLAELLLRQGAKLGEARSLAEESLALYQRHADWKTNEALHALAVLRVALKDQHDYEQLDASLPEHLEFARARQPSTTFAVTLAYNAMDLLGRQKFAEAEPLARESLAIREKHQPDNWTTFNSRSVLGGCLLGQKKYAEAEPLLISGYEGMVRRKETIPSPARLRLKESLQRLVQLHEATIRSDNIDQWKQELAALQKEEELRSKALASARRGQWKEAVADLSRVRELSPEDPEVWQQLAALLIASGQLDAYHEHCRMSVERFGKSGDPVIAERIAKGCLVLPGSGVDLAVLTAMANTAVQATDHWAYIYFRFVKGLAEYRAGNFPRAIEWINKSLAGKGPEALEVEAYMALAMAQARLKNIEAARASFAKGAKIERTNLPSLESGDLGWGWLDWILAHALMSEASAMLENETKLTATSR